MKNGTWLVAGACIIGLGVAGSIVRADEKEPKGHEGHGHEMSPEDQKMMAAMAKAAQPGAEHAHLNKSVGTWKAKISVWHGPGDPEVSEGKSEINDDEEDDEEEFPEEETSF